MNELLEAGFTADKNGNYSKKIGKYYVLYYEGADPYVYYCDITDGDGNDITVSSNATPAYVLNLVKALEGK